MASALMILRWFLVSRLIYEFMNLLPCGLQLYNWHLEINTTKTKIIVFNTTGRRYRFSYDGKILEQVREFKYLGTTLSASGSLMYAKLWKPQEVF